MYTVYIRSFLQGFHQIYGHIRRIYTVLANPIDIYGQMPKARQHADITGTVHVQ
jgi:hypothetical protein